MNYHWDERKPTFKTVDHLKEERMDHKKRDADKGFWMHVENLQQEAVKQLPDAQARKIANEDGLQCSDVLTLELDFRHITKIESLWDFTSLAKLYLNNNLIEKIEGLEYLIKLQFLDLSSNNIKKIEGLDNLRELEMLLLAKNSISVIENMDALENLTLFSIAHNRIAQRDNVFYLKKFKKLFTLCVFDNPAFQHKDYTSDVVAEFPQLMFLDYKLCRDSSKTQPNASYQYAFEKASCESLLDPRAAERAKQQEEAQLKSHTEAFVEFLDGSHLFDTMFEDSVEAELLHSVPGAAPHLDSFKDQVSKLCTQLFESGLEEQKQREKEVELFLSAQRQALKNEQEATMDILTEFEDKLEAKKEELQKVPDAEERAVEIDRFNEEIKELHQVLISREVDLLFGLEDIMALFESEISHMVDTFVVVVKATFSLCRDLETNFDRNICENARDTLEKTATDNLEAETSDQAKSLFSDRETAMEKLATSHSDRLQKINDRETRLLARLNAWKEDLLREINDKHIRQNRFRVRSIYALTDDLKGQLEELQ